MIFSKNKENKIIFVKILSCEFNSSFIGKNFNLWDFFGFNSIKFI